MMFRVLGDILANKKVSQYDLAAMIGKSQAYVSARICGRAAFTLDDVYAICDILGIATENIPLVFPDRRKYKPADVSALLTVAGGDDK